MSERLQTKGNGKAEGEDFMIVSPSEGGYRVYSALHPSPQHLVSGNLNDPACTCDSFAEDGSCEHTRAVQQQFREDARVAREERLAIQAEGEPSSKKKRKATNNNVPAVMTLKRSVSPDGRIDSLSVELSCPIDQVSTVDIKSRAASMVKLQTEIAGGFLNANGNASSKGNGRGNGDARQRDSHRAVPAKMVNIGATRNGKFFISFQANGNEAKFFGGTRELAQAIRSAGYQYREEDVGEGVYLNLPCRVVTKPTSDGRYVNVDRVLPRQVPSPQRRT